METCDRCGARAYVSVLTGCGLLTLCRHHGHEHAEALSAASYPATVIPEPGDSGSALEVDYATL